MFVSKLKMASTFVLVLAAIAGTGVGAYYLHAQAPGSKPEVAKATKSADDMTALLKSRVAAAEKAYQGEFGELRLTRRMGNTIVWQGHPEEIYTWSVRWLQSQRKLTPKHEDQVAALEAHLKRMTELHMAVADMAKTLIPPHKEAEAEWYRLEAEMWLAEEKSAKAK